MRITLISDTYLPEINGVTTVLATMRQGLLARGHAVQVIAPGYAEPGPDEAGVVRRWSVRFPPYPAIRLSLPIGGDVGRALDAFRPDLVHVATEGPLGTVGRRAALARGLPLVTSFHTDTFRATRPATSDSGQCGRSRDTCADSTRRLS